jgi:hypothetical protein
MPKNKQAVNFAVQRALVTRFRDMTKNYFGKLSLCFSAALLMFLEADPQTQAQYIKKVFDAEVNDEMDATLQAAKEEQMRKIRSREEPSKSKRG